MNDDWTSPRPDVIPPPTYAPAALALGIVLLAWGVATTWAISAIGLALILGAVIAWIGDLQRDE